MGQIEQMNVQHETLNPEKDSGQAVQRSSAVALRAMARQRRCTRLEGRACLARMLEGQAINWHRAKRRFTEAPLQRARQGSWVIGTRSARLAPLKPLSFTLRASTRHDAFSVLPPHLEMRNEYPPYLWEPEYLTRMMCRIMSGEIARRRTRRSRPTKALRPPLYVSAKRTHRFLAAFVMEVPVNTLVMAEGCERNRWVRFGKRTHRRGFGSAQSPELRPSGVGTTRRRLGATLAPRLWGLVL
jgi:hypothetical protein